MYISHVFSTIKARILISLVKYLKSEFKKILMFRFTNEIITLLKTNELKTRLRKGMKYEIQASDGVSSSNSS